MLYEIWKSEITEYNLFTVYHSFTFLSLVNVKDKQSPKLYVKQSFLKNFHSTSIGPKVRVGRGNWRVLYWLSTVFTEDIDIIIPDNFYFTIEIK